MIVSVLWHLRKFSYIIQRLQPLNLSLVIFRLRLENLIAV